MILGKEENRCGSIYMAISVSNRVMLGPGCYLGKEVLAEGREEAKARRQEHAQHFPDSE